MLSKRVCSFCEPEKRFENNFFSCCKCNKLFENVLLSINKTTFFKTSETNLGANSGTRKHDYWRDSSYFELKNSSLEGFSEKRSFLDLEHFGKAARQNFSPFKFTHFP